ncbi:MULTISPECIES: hypothetical protein [unclassified Bacillus (in: firmicutes)]|uniref:hypothetical protein n=1 Tax=unclassified Bacillus (in: firmicutes) TaxID=185979 RepID=UPI000BFD11B7|nr:MULTISPECIES: hypothetical protein [unclassified Bacillus (in: firmicutes)]PGX01046.1 hypothetical protein COE07_27155 [Bacillus sp. AFS033286]PGZ67290.1 hypothetical protein COE49_26645 [Bacillus sp. AFS029637]
MLSVQTRDKLYLFYEKYFNNLVVVLIFSISNIFYWLNRFGIGSGDKVTGFLVENILVPREGTLGTIAAVFIGIYFTVFSILGTLKAESTLTMLPKKKFFKLVVFLRNAFLCAFLYLLFSISYASLSESLTGYPKHVLYLFLVVLFCYMFLSALKVGVALFIVFNKDLQSLHTLINEEKQEKEKQKVVFKKMEKYLDDQDEVRARVKAIDMNEIARRKNPPQK